MPARPLHDLLQHLRRTAAAGNACGSSDSELLERFVARQDAAAFELLVWRYGSLVLGVCRRLLRDTCDIEDTFQAAFLVLARRARSIVRRASLGGWLHTVAYRAALAARVRAARRATREQPLDGLSLESSEPGPGEQAAGRELRRALDEQLARLPQKYREVLVLRCLAGKSSAEAARELGCPVGTVESRLTRARARLRDALARRGVTVPASGLALVLSQTTAPAALIAGTAGAARAFAAGRVMGGAAGSVGLAKGVLNAMCLIKFKMAAVVLALVLATGAGLLARPAGGDRPAPAAPVLVPGKVQAVRLPPEWQARLGLRVGEVRLRPAAVPRTLHLSGVLSVAPDRLINVRSRFAGEVVEMGQADQRPPRAGDALRSAAVAALEAIAQDKRPLRVGDAVRRGQLLAVIWSKDLGAKKASLFDALIDLRDQEERLDVTQKFYKNGTIGRATYQATLAKVQSRRVAVNAAERTLRLWKLTDAMIAEVRNEAARSKEGKLTADKEKTWARIEVRAPLAGTILERNVAVGEWVDPAQGNPLFRIADLSQLEVVAQVHEDDLPALLALPPDGRRWVVRPKADPAVSAPGRIERIGPLLDPKTHTAAVRGSVENRDGRLLPGQLITAAVTLPPRSGEVAIPAAALVEDGERTVIFVQPDPKELRYELRRVRVVRRGRDVAHIRLQPGPEDVRQGFASLRPGEHIVIGGAVELRALLEDLRHAEAAPRRPQSHADPRLRPYNPEWQKK